MLAVVAVEQTALLVLVVLEAVEMVVVATQHRKPRQVQ
jgi:hypothetical protein